MQVGRYSRYPSSSDRWRIIFEPPSFCFVVVKKLNHEKCKRVNMREYSRQSVSIISTKLFLKFWPLWGWNDSDTTWKLSGTFPSSAILGNAFELNFHLLCFLCLVCFLGSHLSNLLWSKKSYSNFASFKSFNRTILYSKYGIKSCTSDVGQTYVSVCI